MSITITSSNFNGQLAEITFYPCSGGSINLGYQLLPYFYDQDNYEGNYDIYISGYNKTCQLVITCPTPTPTNTPTTTLTSTPTNTPTTTLTPSPTATNNPICPEQIIISNWSGGTNFAGTYDRLWNASGSTIEYGYWNGTLFGAIGTAPDGYNYPIYKETNSNRYLCRSVYPGSTDNLWALIITFSNPWQADGGGSATINQGFSPTITQGSIRFPEGGEWINLGASGYVAYPSNCPTPTPTSSTTPTLTPTPTSTPAPSFDSDAAAYLNDVLVAGGTGITPTVSAATNTLFTSLKSAGLYNNIDVLYPFLGGVSSSAALNAKRTNSAFDIFWVGGLTFDYSGVTGNGSNGYGSTNYTPGTEASATDMSWGIYQTAGNMGANSGEVYSFGAYDGTYINNHYYLAGDMKLYGYDVPAAGSSLPPSAAGSWIATFDSSNNKSLYLNGSSQFTVSASGSVGLSTVPYFLFTLNLFGSPYTGNYYDGRLQSFFTTTNLTSGQVATMDNIINTFQTSLGRNIY